MINDSNGVGAIITRMLDLKNLANVAKVDKHFCPISNQSKEKITDLDLNTIKTSITDHELGLLLPEYPNLITLNLSDCRHITVVSIQE